MALTGRFTPGLCNSFSTFLLENHGMEYDTLYINFRIITSKLRPLQVKFSFFFGISAANPSTASSWIFYFYFFPLRDKVQCKAEHVSLWRTHRAHGLCHHGTASPHTANRRPLRQEGGGGLSWRP